MRTLSRRLALPQAADVVPDETAYAIYLPRRSTRILYCALALVLGGTGGFVWAHAFARDAGTLWTIAATVIGALLGFVVVLMPAVLVHRVRLLFARIAFARRRAAYSRELARASEDLQQHVEENGNDVQAWNALGVVALLHGDPERALSALERADSHDGMPGVRLNLAVALAERSDFAAAAEMLAEAASDDATSQAAHHNIGVLLTRRPPPPVARRLVDRLDRLASAATLNSLGARELAAGNLDRAEDYFSRAIEQDPVAVAPRANLALVQHRRGRLREAIRGLQEAAVLDPLNPRLVTALGALLCAGGRPMVAARQLSRAALLAPGSPAVELNRGVVRLMLGQHGDALDSFNNPWVRKEYPVLAAHNSALVLIGLDRLGPAMGQLERGLEHDEADIGLHNNLGCVGWALGDDERIQEELSRAAEPGPEHTGVIVNLATARIAAGDAEAALEMLEQLSDDQREHSSVRFLEGLAYLADALKLYSPKMGKRQRERFLSALGRCARPLEEVVDADVQESAEARLNLALYRYLRLEFEAAADGFLRVAAAYPDDGFLRFCAGTALAEAARAVQEAHGARDGGLVGRARDLLKRARRYLQLALELGEVSSDAFCNLGMCAYNLGDTEAARTAFRKMLQLEHSGEAANNLGIVYAQEGLELNRQVRAAGLSSEEREQHLLQRAQKHLSTALRYFLDALEGAPDDPVLHGNIGLAYMLRNRATDVEAALRHWQRMKTLGGAAGQRRYQELSVLAYGGGEARARFDETIMSFRPLDPRECLTTVPPRLAGPRYALQAIDEDVDWELISAHPAVQHALRSRERLAGLRKRLARLSL